MRFRFSVNRPSRKAYLRLGGSAAFQRKRAAPVFVTGWKPREVVRRPSRRHPDGYCRSEDHPVVVARHLFQQAHSVAVERPAREGRRLDRGAGRGHRPAHTPARPQRPTGSGRRRRGDRHVRVPAGGRRCRALQLLVKQKRLAKTAPVPCIVRDPSVDISAEEDSLAENVQRAPLHPLDQFRAFQALRDKGLSEEDIAAAFFVGVSVVKQRLGLAAVSEKLLDVYAEDGMSLDQLTLQPGRDPSDPTGRAAHRPVRRAGRLRPVARPPDLESIDHAERALDRP